jgi:sugar phosphate isomerase/epimerase
MKITVSSYSFAKWMEQNSQLATIQKAKELGFESIAFSSIHPHDGSTEAEYAHKLREECEKQGMTISDYVFPADLIAGSYGDTKAEIARVRKQIDIAEILGVKIIRHDATNGQGCNSFDKVLPTLANACREVTAYAGQKGIRTSVENHGFFCQGSQRLEKLFHAVDHENFGLLCDIGNFLCVDEDPVEAVTRIAPYTIHAHVKDFLFKSGSQPNPGRGFMRTRGGNYLRGTILGHGIVPVLQCLGILQRAGFDGYVGLEYEGFACEDNLTGVALSAKNLNRFIGML